MPSIASFTVGDWKHSGSVRPWPTSWAGKMGCHEKRRSKGFSQGIFSPVRGGGVGGRPTHQFDLIEVLCDEDIAFSQVHVILKRRARSLHLGHRTTALGPAHTACFEISWIIELIIAIKHLSSALKGGDVVTCVSHSRGAMRSREKFTEII